MIARVAVSAALAASVAAAGPASAQFVQKRVVSSAAAKQMISACEALATRNNWKMVIAVLDDGGNLLSLHRMEGAPLRSVEYSQRKARTALMQKAPSKAVADALTGGAQYVLATGLFPVQGGLPIMADGEVAGAIGASGGTAPQDEQCVQAGIDAAGAGGPAAARAPGPAAAPAPAQR
jgi:glc operon protein GlcG